MYENKNDADLLMFANSAYLDEVIKIIKKGNVNINHQNHFGVSALYYAVSNNI